MMRWQIVGVIFGIVFAQYIYAAQLSWQELVKKIYAVQKDTEMVEVELRARGLASEFTSFNTATKHNLSRAQGIQLAMDDVIRGVSVETTISELEAQLIRLEQRAVAVKQLGLGIDIEKLHEQIETTRSRIGTLRAIQKEGVPAIIGELETMQKLLERQEKMIDNKRTIVRQAVKEAEEAATYAAVKKQRPAWQMKKFEERWNEQIARQRESRGGFVRFGDDLKYWEQLPGMRKAARNPRTTVTTFPNTVITKKPAFPVASRMGNSFLGGAVGIGPLMQHEYLSNQGNLNQAKLFITMSQTIILDKRFLEKKDEECNELRSRISFLRVLNITDNKNTNEKQLSDCNNQYKKMKKELLDKKRKLLTIEKELNLFSDIQKQALIEKAANELKHEDYQKETRWPSYYEDQTLLRYFRQPLLHIE